MSDAPARLQDEIMLLFMALDGLIDGMERETGEPIGMDAAASMIGGVLLSWACAHRGLAHTPDAALAFAQAMATGIFKYGGWRADYNGEGHPRH